MGQVADVADVADRRLARGLTSRMALTPCVAKIPFLQNTIGFNEISKRFGYRRRMDDMNCFVPGLVCTSLALLLTAQGP